MSKEMVVILIGLVVVGCGRQPEYHFETRELTPQEVLQYGYSLIDTGTELRKENDASARPLSSKLAVDGSGALINAIAGTVQKLISPGESETVATLIGQALPPRATAFQLTGVRSGMHVYEKKLTSMLGFTVVNVHYKIGYEYRARYQGRGAYIANVTFVPLRVSTDPLWSLRATAVSEAPINIGTRKDPVAKLAFGVSFTAHGPGTRAVTDEFTLDGKTGKLSATIREFEP